MSGIFGIYDLRQRSVEPSTLQKMSDTLRHRGPDGQGIWNHEDVGLGHRMLWTTPESLTEKLPLQNKRGDLVITADARIDNREDLIREFGLAGIPSTEISDSFLILAAYEKWGEKCPENLLGDFAFAIWDKRNQSLFCARDHFGAMPFYYYHSPQMFVFASEIKALLCLAEVPRRMNEMRVGEYLLPWVEFQEFENGQATFYQEIFRLPPRCRIKVTREGISLDGYWVLDPSRRLRFGSDQEYEEAFRDLFFKEVECRLRSAYPVGSMLSGGLDSSSIVCVVRDILARKGNSVLHTFSATAAEESRCNESPYIQDVLRQGRLKSHITRSDQLEPFLEDFEHALRFADEPADITQGSWVSRILSGRAQKEGIRVFFSGVDGDHPTGPNFDDYLNILLRSGRWETLYGELAGMAKIRHCPIWRYLMSFCISRFLPKPAQNIWEILRERGQPESFLSKLINPEFSRRIGLKEREKMYEQEEKKQISKEGHLRRLTTMSLPRALEISSRDSMAFSVEMRYPFLNKRLAEFCLALPDRHKINRGWTKILTRHSLNGYLPPRVQWRRDRSSIQAEFHSYLSSLAQSFFQRVISKELKEVYNYINIQAVHKASERLQSKKLIDHSQQPDWRIDDRHAVWKAVSFALWFQRTQSTA